MVSLAGTIGLVISVIFFSKFKRRPGPLPLVVLGTIAVIEVAIVFYYMTTIELPVL